MADEIWGDDLLGFKSRGDAFTNLVTSITDHRTISIEAGYGRGKTFFRKRWAKQLEAAGECVVEIDARLSDHSGDPVVTFLGALLALVPEKETAKRDVLFAAGKKIAIAGTKAVAKAALREGFEDAASVFDGGDGDASTLQDIAKAAGQELSKAAGDLLAKQLSAEKSRKELGEQLNTLHAQITQERPTDRIVILIDELDRCHPDYAIALLEAMKLVFDQDGFVFVLMVNREYLEKIAAHRFGALEEGEYYLDKFVDLRLKLEAGEGSLSSAVKALGMNLPLSIPFGDHAEFSVERAATLASQLAAPSGLSMRQIKRTLDRVELALRIYKDQPIDVALLVWLGFHEKLKSIGIKMDADGFPRGFLMTPEAVDRVEYLNGAAPRRAMRRMTNNEQSLIHGLRELHDLSNRLFGAPASNVTDYNRKVFEYLALTHIPDHQDMLDAVHALQVDR